MIKNKFNLVLAMTLLVILIFVFIDFFVVDIPYIYSKVDGIVIGIIDVIINLKYAFIDD